MSDKYEGSGRQESARISERREAVQVQQITDTERPVSTALLCDLGDVTPVVGRRVALYPGLSIALFSR